MVSLLDLLIKFHRQTIFDMLVLEQSPESDLLAQEEGRLSDHSDPLGYRPEKSLTIITKRGIF